jgi:DNA-binding beta-propeller fold protein YncE
MNKIFLSCIALLLCFSICFSQTASKAVPSQYNVSQKIHLDGDGSWDLLTMDEPNWNLYVSHGNQVQVVDVRTGKVTGAISNASSKGIHGIAIADDLKKGFISNGKDTSVTVFNIQTLKVLARIKVTGINPDMILYEPFTHRVFAFNGKSSNATVISADSNKVIATLVLPGKPELAVSDGQGKVYLNIEDKSEVCVINPKSLSVENNWKIAPGKEASGIAMDIKSHRLFMVCDNKLMVILNGDNGKVVQSLPIGSKADGVAFDPVTKRIYSSNGEGTLTVVQEVDENSFKVLENVTTQKGAKTLAIDTRTHFIYLSVAEYEASSKEDKHDAKAKPKIKPNTFNVLVVKPEE